MSHEWSCGLNANKVTRDLECSEFLARGLVDIDLGSNPARNTK
jgi:hypothetical protein